MKKFVTIMSVALIAILSLTLLVACAPASDPEKALKALKANEYDAVKDTLIVSIGLTGLGVKGVDTVITGKKTVKDGDKNKLETVTIVYFVDAGSAKEAFQKVQKYADDERENKNDTDWTFKQSGKMIYYGTKAAIKAAR